jgi:hypothetical protein
MMNLLRDIARGAAFAIGAALVVGAVYVSSVLGQGAGCTGVNTLNCMLMGGGDWEVGGIFNIYGAGQLQIGGVNRTAALATAPAGVAAGYKIARGQASTVTASDTIVTGLSTVVSVTCQMDDAPTTDPEIATCSIGNQSGAPAAGAILLQTWKTLGGTPAAATTFSKKVNWIAVGT